MIERGEQVINPQNPNICDVWVHQLLLFFSANMNSGCSTVMRTSELFQHTLLIRKDPRIYVLCLCVYYEYVLCMHNIPHISVYMYKYIFMYTLCLAYMHVFLYERKPAVAHENNT